MRNLILILGMLILASCSKDDNSCKCDVEIIVVSGSAGVTDSYTIIDVPNTCDSQFNNSDNFDVFREQQNLPSNHWFRKVKNCK